MELFTKKKILNVLITHMICLGAANIVNASPLKNITLSVPDTIQQSSNAIAGGLYVNNIFLTRPLLATSFDGGTTWSYPSSISSTLPSDISRQALFTGARCSRMNCLASGYYERSLSSGEQAIFPLLAASQDGGDTWTYPSTITSTLPSNFAKGNFVGDAWCSGLNCIVAGKYATTDNLELPLLASSHDGGSTWNYPASVITNLPSDFLNQASFTDNACVAKNCLATGQYQNILNKYIPFLASSSDGGTTWTYPQSIISNLPNDFDNAGIFNSVSCNTVSCVAAGDYSSTKPNNPLYPLIAVSRDFGSTWLYPTSTIANLPSDFVNVISMNNVSCNANNCIAVGQYQSNKANAQLYPLLASSQDGGNTWAYPLTIITDIPTDYQNSAIFNGATCNRNICIAVGEYQSSNWGGLATPLLARSQDGGKTWIYSNSISANLPNDASSGKFLSVSCNRNDCTAKGQYQSFKSGTPFYPLVATSHDAGITWTYPSSVISNLPADYFNDGIFSGGNSSYDLKNNEI